MHVDRTMNSSQVFDKYSESVGHLVMTEDGAVTNVSWFSDVSAWLIHGCARAQYVLLWHISVLKCLTTTRDVIIEPLVFQFLTT